MNISSFNKNILIFEKNLSASMLFFVVSLTFTAAVLRTAGYPQAWMNDLAKLFFAWVIFIGSDIALANRLHIGVEFFEEKLPKQARLIIKQMFSLTIIGLLTTLCYYGNFLAQRSRREFESLSISEASMAIILATFILCVFLFSFKDTMKKNLVLALGACALSSVVTATIILTCDLSFEKSQLSHSYLISAIPAGCLLMIRTEILELLKNTIQLPATEVSNEQQPIGKKNA
ncbi:TRAP transporter small permease [Vibrio tasmaniensis]|uniref:TRAP transporter small permease n=1 Tax=Vibrio tasmaniensis TaxID=212663 RepID=UPI00107FC896|nr:TRAP transporter small permease [Vibrio tasmaniensis]